MGIPGAVLPVSFTQFFQPLHYLNHLPIPPPNNRDPYHSYLIFSRQARLDKAERDTGGTPSRADEGWAIKSPIKG
jgi:hypothetical protein